MNHWLIQASETADHVPLGELDWLRVPALDAAGDLGGTLPDGRGSVAPESLRNQSAGTIHPLTAILERHAPATRTHRPGL